jgi:CRP-like cAMP-binding protein
MILEIIFRTFEYFQVLASEGYCSPFIGFIKTGTCHVLRKVDAVNLANDKKKIVKEVIISSLKQDDSFGEISVVQNEPMRFSIMTATECKLGIITYEKATRKKSSLLNSQRIFFMSASFKVIDETTRRLLAYTNEADFFKLTQDDIHKTFIMQESKNEWVNFKASVVDQVLDKYACRRF